MIADQLRTRCAGNEVMAAVFLSPARPMPEVMLHEGTPDSVPLPTALILERGAHIGASHLLLIHTHPSGNPLPSAQDMIATRRLYRHLRSHGMRLHDHLILARERYFSFRMQGLL